MLFLRPEAQDACQGTSVIASCMGCLGIFEVAIEGWEDGHARVCNTDELFRYIDTTMTAMDIGGGFSRLQLASQAVRRLTVP